MLACYVVNTNSEDGSGKKKCAPMLEDYYECLHHRKEVRHFHPPYNPQGSF
jgi:NADH dehydrogenase (ubiquinone) Fe-S protein 5